MKLSLKGIVSAIVPSLKKAANDQLDQYKDQAIAAVDAIVQQGMAAADSPQTPAVIKTRLGDAIHALHAPDAVKVALLIIVEDFDPGKVVGPEMAHNIRAEGERLKSRIRGARL